MPYNSGLRCSFFIGSNIKRDGTVREWDHAEGTGLFWKSSNGEIMVKVSDPQAGHAERAINLSTFTGEQWKDDNLIARYENGKRIKETA